MDDQEILSTILEFLLEADTDPTDKLARITELVRDKILLAIQELLDGKVWTPETLESIADLLRANGYRVRDSEDRN